MKNRTIILKSISLLNFKGIRSLTVNFTDQENSIRGDNATGKTTIMDAFTFLLFGKDSSGRADFNIKTLDSSGTPIHNLDHEVSAVLLMNGETITLKKIYREKWTKPRGQKEQVFSGHETTYYYNDVPLAQKDYNIKIEQICPEKVFKLLTSPLYFPGTPWLEQRQTLIQCAGAISDEEIVSQNPLYADLIRGIQGTKTLEEYKREIAMKKKRIKDDLEQIPARIDEVQRSMPEAQDWNFIESEIRTAQENITKIESEIADMHKGLEGSNSGRIDLQKQIGKSKTIKENIEHEAITHIDNLKYEYDRTLRTRSQHVRDFEEIIRLKENTIKGLNLEIESLKERREKKLAEWHTINNETLSFSHDTICPTCGQYLPEGFLSGKKAEAESKFNENKAYRLSVNVSEGKRIAESIRDAEKNITIAQGVISDTTLKLNELNAQVIKEPEYQSEKAVFLQSRKYDSLASLIQGLEKELSELGETSAPDTSILQSKKGEEISKLDSLKKELGKRDQISSGNNRIATLKADQQKLSQELADLEKTEYLIAGFNKAKIEAVESRINNMFRIVRFRMYNEQVNGGLAETCECIVDGVPYSDLNSAMKINAGMDILSTLSEKFGVYAPIFVDNRETINDLLPVKSQVINLVVTRDKELVFN